MWERSVIRLEGTKWLIKWEDLRGGGPAFLELHDHGGVVVDIDAYVQFVWYYDGVLAHHYIRELVVRVQPHRYTERAFRRSNINLNNNVKILSFFKITFRHPYICKKPKKFLNYFLNTAPSLSPAN